ncbi:MAG: SCO family protein [Bacteroidota bacterium]
MVSDRLLLAIAAVLGSFVLALALLWQPDLARPLPPPGPAADGDFTLQSASGPLSLHDFRGKLVLVYFGYTYCPDVCPTSLAATAEGLKQLRPEELARVAVIFVSVDPQRDTPARLKDYVEFFHPAMVGVTGTPEELAEIARRYGVFYARQPADTAGGYVVDHSSDTYVVGPNGKLRGRIPHATPPEGVALAIRDYLKQP